MCDLRFFFGIWMGVVIEFCFVIVLYVKYIIKIYYRKSKFLIFCYLLIFISKNVEFKKKIICIYYYFYIMCNLRN